MARCSLISACGESRWFGTTSSAGSNCGRGIPRPLESNSKNVSMHSASASACLLPSTTTTSGRSTSSHNSTAYSAFAVVVSPEISRRAGPASARTNS